MKKKADAVLKKPSFLLFRHVFTTSVSPTLSSSASLFGLRSIDEEGAISLGASGDFSSGKNYHRLGGHSATPISSD